MSTCNRCGISAWHPEARVCTITNCELRAAATDCANGATTDISPVVAPTLPANDATPPHAGASGGEITRREAEARYA